MRAAALLLTIFLLGCTWSQNEVRSGEDTGLVTPSKDLPEVPPSDLSYDKPYAPEGQHVFVMHKDIGLQYRGGRRGVIQISCNLPVKHHEAYTNEHGFKQGLVSWTKEYKTQTHIEVVFARRSLPTKCYIHVDVTFENGTKESVYFLLRADQLTQCRSPF